MTPAPTQAEEETNVRVAARVRPLLPREKAAGCCSCITVHAASRQLVVGTRRTFAFDVVFDEGAGQAEVYDECVAPLLAGCLQGYNATILAYGQTGSGKTHTMGTGQASPQSAEEEGIAPKVIRSSFEHVAEHAEEVSFKATCCYIEIYNEEIRDLLQPNAPKHLIQVRETADGVIQVAGIHSEVCSSAEDMMRCLNDGSVQRTTGATLMNEQSSRSHSIFTIILEQRRRGRRDSRASVDGEEASGSALTGEDDTASRPTYRTAKFHLVDLAGSERAKRTGAVGSRFKESVSINGGLLALGNVISALGDPAKRGFHVPYRESKLTRLLQDGLGGNSRTLMIACASGADGDFEETLNTLKYANRARNIKNKPVVNQDPKVAQLAAMQDEIEALRSALQRASEASPPVPPPQWVGLGSEADAVIGELTEKVATAERRSEELSARLEGSETECEAVRRSLADVYSTVRQHLPAIYHASTSSSVSASEAGSAKQALAAVSASLQAAQRVLGDTGGDGAGAGCEAWLGQLPSQQALGASAGDARASGSDLPGYGDFPVEVEVGSDGLPAPSADAPGFRTLSEVRRDSTVLIRKYLDEIKRLEAELALHRRRTKQLQEELRDAKEDLAKDEEIFEEKLQEMRALSEQNAALQSELCEALATVSGSPTNASRQGTAWAGGQEPEQEQKQRPGGGGPSQQERGTARCWEDRSGEAAADEEHADEAVQAELQESRDAQQRLERELQALAQSVSRREEKIEDLARSEREWGSAKAQYQRRMEQLQAELDDMQRELATLHNQLQESEQLKEQKRQMEEEKRRLERLISDQEECIRKKKQDFGRLRDLRQQDSKRIRDLEWEVSQLACSQRDKEAKLQAERRREAQQISELQRRLAKEGQRVRELEKENHRQKESLKSSHGPQRQRSATPFGRWTGSAGAGASGGSTPAGAQAARPASVDATARAAGAIGVTTAGGSSSSSARAHQLEQKLDEYIRRQEAAQNLQDDQRKKDALVEKHQQYTSYRRKIATKDTLEQQEAHQQLEQLEAQLKRAERELVEASAADPEAAQRARARREALAAEHLELQRSSQAKRAEGQGILHDIDERLEVLQDEIDFRETRIAKARHLAHPGAPLDAELAGLPGEDAKDLLCRYCEKIVRLRQRERASLRRFAANEAQLQEKSRQVSELQQVLRNQNANASRYAAKVAKEYEAQIRLLQQQLEAAQQRAAEHSGEDGPGNSDSSSAKEAGSSGVVGGEAEAVELQRLRRESKCLRTVNRELKRRLRGFMMRGGHAPADGGHPQGAPVAEAHEAASAAGAASPAEELAGQVAQLMREKEALAEENRRVLAQVRGLKQYNARYHNINAAGALSEAVPEILVTPPHA